MGIKEKIDEIERKFKKFSLKGRTFGEMIVFSKSHIVKEGPKGPSDPNTIFRYETYLINSDGSNLNKVADKSPDSWSPDGKKLIFTKSEGKTSSESNYTLSFINIKDGNEIVSYEGYLEAYNGIHFVDNDNIVTPRAYAKKKLKGIIKINLKKGTQEYIYKNPLFNGNLNVSPSGTKFLFEQTIDNSDVGSLNQITGFFLYEPRRNSLIRMPIILKDKIKWVDDNIFFANYSDYGKDINYVVKVDLRNLNDIKIISKLKKDYIDLEDISSDGSLALIWGHKYDFEDKSKSLFLVDTHTGEKLFTMYDFHPMASSFSKRKNEFVFPKDDGLYINNINNNQRKIYSGQAFSPKWQP